MHDYAALSHLYDEWIDYPGLGLERDFPESEYQLRLRLARGLLKEHALDGLVITSSAIGQWFTSSLEPHEWHDLCPSRSAWFVLTETDDRLYMTPTAGGEHFNTTRRSTWVSDIRQVVERSTWPRTEIWDLDQVTAWFRDLGLERSRVGFELGDCMTLGISVLDFLRLRELMPHAELTDGSAVIRRLMSVHTPAEIDRVRLACEAGVWIHARVTELLRPGMTERQLFDALEDRFAAAYGDDYQYRAAGVWDVRNPTRDDSNQFHAVATSRPYAAGDVVFRGWSGVWFRGYPADVDRCWSVGKPSRDVLDLYRMTWECNRAMAEAVRPGNRCSDVHAAGAAVERRYGFVRKTGRTGHGLRNTGGLSVHPDNHTRLEAGMILSVEPMFSTVHGFFDLEDQYVLTEVGAEPLHELAPEELPVID